jgi:hypothetical protein
MKNQLRKIRPLMLALAACLARSLGFRPSVRTVYQAVQEQTM